MSECPWCAGDSQFADIRGASTTIGYALTLGVTTLLITGLLFAGGSFVEDTREEAVRAELSVIGQQVSADLQAADRLARVDPDNGFLTERSYPRRVAGLEYIIEIVPSGPYVRLQTTDPDVTIEIDTVVETTITASASEGGTVTIRYDPSGGMVVSDD